MNENKLKPIKYDSSQVLFTAVQFSRSSLAMLMYKSIRMITITVVHNS